jgi:hypothetical protein
MKLRMKMKKKIAVTTIAASLMLSSLSGFPTSDKGIAGPFHTNVASAATLPDSSLLSKFNGVYAELAKDNAGLTAVNAAKAKLDQLSASSTGADIAEKEALVTEIWTKVSAKINGDTNYVTDITPVAIYNVFSRLAITNDLTGDSLVTAITDNNLRNTVNKLATLSGLSGGFNAITLNDFNLFYNGLITALETNKTGIMAGNSIVYVNGRQWNVC